MMPGSFDRSEDLWDGLLSRQPELVEAAFASLDESEQQSILAHLKRMASEPGWHPEQASSAQVALKILHI
jgi:hypothetical protein